MGNRPVIGPAPQLYSPEQAEKLWARPGVHVDATDLRMVFGEKVPSLDQLLDAWSDPKEGIRAEFHSVGMASNTISVNFTLRGRDGTAYTEGLATRDFTRENGKLSVYNAYLVTYDESPRGMGGRLTRGSLTLYSHLGVEKVTVSPAWAGKYVWGTFGFHWDDAKAQSVRRDFELFLIANGVPPGVAAHEAVTRHKHPWMIGEYDYRGTTVMSPRYHVTRDRGQFETQEPERLGKAFMLRQFWKGTLRLDDVNDPSWRRADERLFQREP